ncbi:Gamma-aminobutyric acid type B receptor subunit 2 [Trichinella spiralis]|uniref:Gamma-aminobutyric acid type B receptor subunit 2 n=2 Tax=Trichinella TaxID=6333 RepID=A0A0V1AVR4_TRISP|nr:Gamma-aminobutyric acid type B receptor subunit 2 [Trichinella spiralis]KRY28880.1 Gamma-aminobutyric acid type B receptor subunit 2 [Trichinella spiralis]
MACERYVCKGVLLVFATVIVTTVDVLCQKCNHWHRRPFTPGKEIPLYIGAMFSSVEESTHIGAVESNLRPAIDIALADINNHPCVLRGYNLTLINKDTQCKPSMGMKSFFDMMNEERKKLAIFGGACTRTNELVAMAANFWHKVQLSYAENHPMFSSRDSKDMYQTFYRIVPGHRDQLQARIRFLHHFNWTKVGAIVQNDDSRHSLHMEAFTTAIERKHGVAILATHGFSSTKMNIREGLKHLKAKDARIIIGEFNVSLAAAVFCEAYSQKLYGPEYVWIIPGYHQDYWWLSKTDQLPCSRFQLRKALEGHFALRFTVIRSDTTRVWSDKTAAEYDAEYRAKCKPPHCQYSKYHGYVYDGLWTIAQAAENLITTMMMRGKHFNPEQDLLDSDRDVMGAWKLALMEAIDSLEFEGVTGKVRFYQNERLGRIRIVRFQNQSYTAVGEYDGAEDRFTLFGQRIIWQNGSPPADAIQEVIIRRYVDYSVFYIMCSLVAICIMLAIALLTVNIYFRNHKFIKMSSPNVNNLIILGSIMTYCSVILLGIDTNMVSELDYSRMCTAKVWILCFGFTLAFGSMFAKTWRVHSIFNDIHLHKKAIKDYKLFLIVGVLLLIDVLILSTWLIIDPMQMAVKQLPTEKDERSNLLIKPTIEYCKTDYTVVFQALLYGYKGIFLVLGCFLAWETRNVNVPALNDSKYIGMSVYNVVLVCGVGVAISFILQDQINECYIIISMFIIFCTTVTLALVFVPKIVELMQNHRDPTIHYPRAMMRSLYVINKNRMLNKDIREQILRQEKEKRILKRRLSAVRRETLAILKYSAKLGTSVHQVEDDHSKRETVMMQASDDDRPYGGVYVGPTDEKPRISCEALVSHRESHSPGHLFITKKFPPTVAKVDQPESPSLSIKSKADEHASSACRSEENCDEESSKTRRCCRGEEQQQQQQYQTVNLPRRSVTPSISEPDHRRSMSSIAYSSFHSLMVFSEQMNRRRGGNNDDDGDNDDGENLIPADRQRKSQSPPACSSYSFENQTVTALVTEDESTITAAEDDSSSTQTLTKEPKCVESQSPISSILRLGKRFRNRKIANNNNNDKKNNVGYSNSNSISLQNLPQSSIGGTARSKFEESANRQKKLKNKYKLTKKKKKYSKSCQKRRPQEQQPKFTYQRTLSKLQTFADDRNWRQICTQLLWIHDHPKLGRGELVEIAALQCPLAQHVRATVQMPVAGLEQTNQYAVHSQVMAEQNEKAGRHTSDLQFHLRTTVIGQFVFVQRNMGVEQNRFGLSKTVQIERFFGSNDLINKSIN